MNGERTEEKFFLIAFSFYEFPHCSALCTLTQKTDTPVFSMTSQTGDSDHGGDLRKPLISTVSRSESAALLRKHPGLSESESRETSAKTPKDESPQLEKAHEHDLARASLENAPSEPDDQEDARTATDLEQPESTNLSSGESVYEEANDTEATETNVCINSDDLDAGPTKTGGSFVAEDGDPEPRPEPAETAEETILGTTPGTTLETPLGSSTEKTLGTPEEAPGMTPEKTTKTKPPTNDPQNLPPRNYLPLTVDSPLYPPLESASSLLQAKQWDIFSRFRSKDQALQEAITSGISSIKNTFNEIRSTIDHFPAEHVGGPIDWDLWTRVVEDYNAVIQQDQAGLIEAVARGIPKSFRGIVWQSVARSKNVLMEELYLHLKTEKSMHEKAIKRDLTRTSFFTKVEAVEKAGELFNVIKAYSNFDPDVGYTQGMAFIAIPLIMNMTESECFCLLVTLMKEYDLREMFCPQMKGLHLLLYQFDRLLEQKLPLLFNHLARQGVRSLMYASQWFLTFFSYKFPLDVVLRIFDLIITQGTEALIQLAVNLVLRNEQSVLLLKFDALLEFLKLRLFNIYVSDEFVHTASPEPAQSRFALLSRRSSAAAASYYKLDEFMRDSIRVDLCPLDLARYKAEFEVMCGKDDARAAEIEDLKLASGQLRHEIKAREAELSTLNHGHLSVVQELVDKKVMMPEVSTDIEDLQRAVATLKKDIADLESKLNAGSDTIPHDIESKIQYLLQQTAHATERFAELDEQLTRLTVEDKQLELELKSTSKGWFWDK